MASQVELRPSDSATDRNGFSLFRWIFGGIVVLGIVTVAALWWNRSTEKPAHGAVSASEGSAASTGDDEDAVRVEAVQPTPGGISRKSTQVGTVHAYQEAPLYAKASGYLKTLKVDIGDRVQEGEELAVIDDPELVKEKELSAAELKQAQASVRTFEAAIKAYQAAAEAAKARVEEALALIDRYAATRKFREKELARFQGLYNDRAVPKSVVEEEEEHLESARAAERSAKAGVNTARQDEIEASSKVMKARADLEEAKAKVDVAKALHEKFEVLVGYLRIVSPYKGVVTARNVHPGYFIRSASEGTDVPLLVVARTDLMRVVTYVPDRDVPYVDAGPNGDKAEVALDALNTTITSKVWRFADAEDPESRTMRTEILLPNQDGKIRQGMFGLATIYLGETKAALTIPTACLAGEANNGNGSVFVVRDGKAKRTAVKIGADDGIRLEVLKGLTVNDKVITTINSVTDGASVVVVEPD